jgi:hypothetical protein
MDSFSLIQQFFTQMTCQHCQEPFEPESIQLIREDKGVYLVSVNCHHCQRQVGVAMVGVESNTKEATQKYADPELTPEEKERLSAFTPVETDDVIEAHQFFQNLGRDWQKYIPAELRERCLLKGEDEPVKHPVQEQEPEAPPG